MAQTVRKRTPRVCPPVQVRDRESWESSSPDTALSKIRRTSKRQTHAPDNQFPDRYEFGQRAPRGNRRARQRQRATERKVNHRAPDLLLRLFRLLGSFSSAQRNAGRVAWVPPNRKMYVWDRRRKLQLRRR